MFFKLTKRCFLSNYSELLVKQTNKKTTVKDTFVDTIFLVQMFTEQGK